MSATTRGRAWISLLQRPSKLLGWSLLAALTGAAAAQTAPGSSYYEFGTVVAIGRQSVDIQTFDQQRQRLVQHSFALTKETHADVVRVGDAVEVVFLINNGDWNLKRLIMLPTGIPVAGPPPPVNYTSGRTSGTSTTAPALAVPAVTQPALAQQTARSAAAPQAVPYQSPVPTPAPAVPQAKDAQLVSAKSKTTKKVPKAKPVPLLQPATTVSAATAKTTTLASNAAPKVVPGAVPVQLGASAEAVKNLTPRSSKDVAIDRPNEECNRSSADWPNQPLRMAVLDFRYPTEREEAHDIGTTGGGSGTAVADLVFARLEQLEQVDDRYAFSRGDRRRLDRSDFAGAARLGRQLGVDAVLAGTFVPVTPEGQSADDFSPPKTYELRAGIVDTCTGQLLLQTSSVSCPGGLEPGITTGANPASCKRLAASAAQTADPKDNAAAFRPLLDDLLYPLEHLSTAAQTSAVGKVVGVQGGELTVQLNGRTGLRAGDQIGVHASRLAKNPTTYTLRNLQDEEIGRMTIRDVQGTTARGTFAGDYTPRPGDTVQPLTN